MPSALLHNAPIGLIEPPTVRLKPLSTQQRLDGQMWMEHFGKHYQFKPGAIRSKATQSYTKSLTAKCIRAIARNCRQEWLIANAESYDATRQRSADLFGVADLIVVSAYGTRYVQACGKDWQPHIAKFADYDHINTVRILLANPANTLELWGWQQYPKIKADGTTTKQSVWLPRVQRITLPFLLGEEPPTMLNFWETI